MNLIKNIIDTNLYTIIISGYTGDHDMLDQIYIMQTCDKNIVKNEFNKLIYYELDFRSMKNILKSFNGENTYAYKIPENKLDEYLNK